MRKREVHNNINYKQTSFCKCNFITTLILHSSPVIFKYKSSVHSLLLIFSALCFLLRGYEQKLQKLNTKQKIQHSSPNSRAQIIREYQTSIWFTALSFNSNNFERFTDKIKDLDIAQVGLTLGWSSEKKLPIVTLRWPNVTLMWTTVALRLKVTYS